MSDQYINIGGGFKVPVAKLDECFSQGGACQGSQIHRELQALRYMKARLIHTREEDERFTKAFKAETGIDFDFSQVPKPQPKE